MDAPQPESRRFTLERGHWYIWTMYPGYGSGPYESPIRVDGIESIGQRTLRLRFFDPGYAVGVQDFDLHLRTVTRQAEFMVCEQVDVPGRVVTIQALHHEWLTRHVPTFTRGTDTTPEAWLNSMADEEAASGSESATRDGRDPEWPR